MIYPIRAPMALFLPVGSLWKDWMELKPACGRRSNFAHAQRVDAVGWQRKDWVQKRCPLTHCQDLALGDLSRSAYIHTFDVAMQIKQNDAKEISVYLKCSSPCTHTKRRKNWERFSLPLFMEGFNSNTMLKLLFSKGIIVSMITSL